MVQVLSSKLDHFQLIILEYLGLDHWMGAGEVLTKSPSYILEGSSHGIVPRVLPDSCWLRAIYATFGVVGGT